MNDLKLWECRVGFRNEPLCIQTEQGSETGFLVLQPIGRVGKLLIPATTL